MKTQRRHELATNVLAECLGETIESVKPYSTAISATILGALVALFGWIYWSHKNEQTLEQGWERYFDALDESHTQLGGVEKLHDVAEQYGDTAAGLWARLSLADTQLDKGVQQLFEDRAVAKEALNDAEDGYRYVLDHAQRDSMLAERATLGLAETYESQNQLDQAREKYRELIDKFPQSAYTSQAQQRLADLEKPATKRFYDWFAQQTPKSKSLLGPGTPGEKPAFDFDSLRQPLGDQPFHAPTKKKSGPKPDDAAGSEETDRQPAEEPTGSNEPGEDQAGEEKSGDAAATEKPAGDEASGEEAPEAEPADEKPPAEQPKP